MSKTTLAHQTLSYLNAYRRRVFKSQALVCINDAINQEKLAPSVFFFTTHKCASVFIPRILHSVQNNSSRLLKYRDYAKELWSLSDRIDLSDGYESFLQSHYSLLYRMRGFLYGPQRKPLVFNGINAFKKIFFLRDPRDVIVSSYYSFGGSHSLPLNASERFRINLQKQSIGELDIDDYAINYSLPRILQTYNSYIDMIKQSKSEDIHICTYDQFVSDPVSFILNISRFCGVENNNMVSSAVKLAAIASPVRTKVSNSSHKRDGSSQQYTSKLDPHTISILNEELKDTIVYFGFE